MADPAELIADTARRLPWWSWLVIIGGGVGIGLVLRSRRGAGDGPPVWVSEDGAAVDLSRLAIDTGGATFTGDGVAVDNPNRASAGATGPAGTPPAGTILRDVPTAGGTLLVRLPDDPQAAALPDSLIREQLGLPAIVQTPPPPPAWTAERITAAAAADGFTGLVSAVPLPGGAGGYAFLSDGGVITFGAAPFLGAANNAPYWTAQNPDRRAIRGELTPTGYRIVSQWGETYDFP